MDMHRGALSSINYMAIGYLVFFVVQACHLQKALQNIPLSVMSQ